VNAHAQQGVDEMGSESWAPTNMNKQWFYQSIVLLDGDDWVEGQERA